MNCHECFMDGHERPAVALCSFCSIGLCKDHLVAALREPPTVPEYRCQHHPARPAKPLEEHAETAEPTWARHA